MGPPILCITSHDQSRGPSSLNDDDDLHFYGMILLLKWLFIAFFPLAKSRWSFPLKYALALVFILGFYFCSLFKNATRRLEIGIRASSWARWYLINFTLIFYLINVNVFNFVLIGYLNLYTHLLSREGPSSLTMGEEKAFVCFMCTQRCDWTLFSGEIGLRKCVRSSVVLKRKWEKKGKQNIRSVSQRSES